MVRYISAIVQEVNNVFKGRHYDLPLMCELLQVFSEFVCARLVNLLILESFFQVVRVRFS